ncbi:MAG: hypothetical protein E7294_10880 [Lachnospiraceae bacterium]|nr:hypothetical protein [Lachnospiraceae bacterium]
MNRMRNNIGKKIILYSMIFVVTVLCLTGILAASARIPTEKLQENMKKSAGFLCEREVFFKLSENLECSNIDRYADSILLSIAYHFEPEHPLTSVMNASYYFTEYQNENQNFYESVTKRLPANQQYLRYWHGSAAVVRFLHLFFSLRQIYQLHAVLLAVLALSLIFVLLWHRFFGAATGIVCALTAVSIWYVPFSLEYTWMFLWALIAALAAVVLALKGEEQLFFPFFLIVGIVANWLDFLTTETVTLLIPLLLVLAIKQKKEKENSPFGFVAGCCGLWGIGYACMWITKWVLASIVLSENAMPYVKEHIGERIGIGEEHKALREMAGAIKNNIRCLFPANLGPIGVAVVCAVGIVLLYLCWVYPKKEWDRRLLFCCIFLGVIPYIRYLVLHDHSYLHFFFTYRAQAAGILALGLIVTEIVDWRCIGNGVRRKKKS